MAYLCALFISERRKYNKSQTHAMSNTVYTLFSRVIKRFPLFRPAAAAAARFNIFVDRQRPPPAAAVPILRAATIVARHRIRPFYPRQLLQRCPRSLARAFFSLNERPRFNPFFFCRRRSCTQHTTYVACPYASQHPSYEKPRKPKFFLCFCNSSDRTCHMDLCKVQKKNKMHTSFSHA